MKMLHVVGKTFVHRTPSRIAHYWSRYFNEHSGTAVIMKRRAPYDKVPRYVCWFWEDTTCPGGFFSVYSGGKDIMRHFLHEADVIHCHDDAYPTMFESKMWGIDISKKVLVYHAHIGSILERCFHNSRRFRYNRRVKHACIPNGYGRIFDIDEKEYKRRWGRLSDVLDLSHPAYRPEPMMREPQRPGKLNVVYTYSNNKEGGRINAKRPRQHKKLVKQVSGIDFVMVNGLSLESSLALKKMAHVVLEEVYTEYLHLSALEGAAVGAMVVTKFDDYTKAELSNYVGAPEGEWPFYYADQDTLIDTLNMLRHEPELVAEWGRKGRAWMEKYFETRRSLERFLDFYRS